MRIGNVIKCPSGDKWIVTSVTDKLVSFVSFDFQGMSGTQQMEDHTRLDTCGCYHDTRGHGPEDDCETCHGTGTYEVSIKGWKHSKVLAESVKDFIMKGIKKTFDI